MPDWLTLVLGAVLALAGSLLGQYFSDKQARKRDLEQQAHEQKVWLRNLRYDLNNQFTRDFQGYWDRLDRRWIAPEHAGPPLDGGELLKAMLELTTRMDLWSSPDVAFAARGAVALLDKYAEDQTRYNDLWRAFNEFKRLARLEAGIHCSSDTECPTLSRPVDTGSTRTADPESGPDPDGRCCSAPTAVPAPAST